MLRWFTRTASDPPAAAGSVIRDVEGDGWRVRLDLAPQVLSLEIPETEVAWARQPGELSPVCPPTEFVSASMLAVKAKLFDDGLYAAAELASQPGKARMIAALAGLSPTVAAAAHLGGLGIELTPAARDRAARFLDDEVQSKPLGFYTWRDDLRRIFQQDRILQSELEIEEAAALASAIGSDPTLAAEYARHLDFAAKLTNAFSSDKPDLRRPGGRFLLPPSRSHEVDLAKRLVGSRPVPPGFSLAAEMLNALRAGQLDLAPGPSSGWYDVQTWALEPLALLEKMPEARRLRTNGRYREQLDELFKAVLSLTRETHVKQLDMASSGAARGFRMADPTAWIQPTLTVEPLRTHYERRAQAYEFVRNLLEGDGRLAGLRRLTPDGAVREPLGDELAGMIAIFRSAAAVAGHELGMEAAGGDAQAALTRFAKSPDADQDIRMMVPVFYDEGRGKLKVWAVLGWDERQLRCSFAVEPAAQVLKGTVIVRFVPAFYRLAYPVFAEAYVSRLMDRDEFRAHCDRHRTVERILAAL